ncbi:MAG: FliH/SctL family protein [Candidatus Margulisbacteria bacterium]|nr:FliH/SctL family protein [Candidatus Margulisiibacteriota bacterium]
MKTGKIIKAEEAVARNLKSVSPVLSSYFTEAMVVEMLQEGEKLALVIKKKEDEMMVKANEHVEQKKQQLNNQMEEIKQKGYQEGYDAGKQEFADKVKDFTLELEQIRLKIGQATEDYLQNVEKQIVSFSLAIAEKITRVTFQNKTEVLVSFIKSLFDQVSIRDSITIKVNPKQYDRINKYKNEFSEYLGVVDLGIQKDSNIDECGVGISMNTGFMDASLQSIFSQLEKNLLNE